jgi:endonuclease-3 related protein
MPDSSSVREPENPSGQQLLAIYELLYAAYGPQHWWPGMGGFETIVGAILTQSAAWPNVELALDRLRAADALQPANILAMDERDLAALVRPSGYFNAKARKLRAFCEMLESDFDGRLNLLLALPACALRTRLLSTYGIGPETADDIVLYAAAQPSFVIDTYTCRIFSRIGIVPERDNYGSWRALFMNELPADAALYNEYHALIVRHAKVSCAKRPACAACVLRDVCITGAEARS